MALTPRPLGLDDLHPATFVQGWCLSENGDCNGVVYSEGRVATGEDRPRAGDRADVGPNPGRETGAQAAMCSRQDRSGRSRPDGRAEVVQA